MRSKTRLSSYCTKRANNGVNLVTSRKINTRLARPIPCHQLHRLLVCSTLNFEKNIDENNFAIHLGPHFDPLRTENKHRNDLRQEQCITVMIKYNCVILQR